jgi:hypothetical protein
LKLKFLDCTPIELSIERNFESMGEGLMFISVVASPKVTLPFRWFLEDGRKPGFDLAIDSYKGIFNKFTFFLQDEKVEHTVVQMAQPDLIQSGAPRFDLSFWSENQYHIFEEGSIRTVFQNGDLFMLMSERVDRVSYEVELNSKHSMFFSQEGDLIGIVMKKIDSQELQAMKNSNVL